MGNLSFFEILIISVIIFLVVFMILREVFCWYYKINQRIENQERSIFLLERIYEKLGGELIADDKKADSKTADGDNDDENKIYDYRDKMNVPRRGLPKQAREKGWVRDYS